MSEVRQLAALRQQLQGLDDDILKYIRMRMALCAKIGAVKKENNWNIENPVVEAETRARFLAAATGTSSSEIMTEAMADELYQYLVKWSKWIQGHPMASGTYK
jgi:chorismate mutase